MSLSGTVDDPSLPNLIQVIYIERRRACVRMTSHRREGILLFLDGELIYARLGGLVGVQAVRDLV